MGKILPAIGLASASLPVAAVQRKELMKSDSPARNFRISPLTMPPCNARLQVDARSHVQHGARLGINLFALPKLDLDGLHVVADDFVFHGLQFIPSRSDGIIGTTAPMVLCCAVVPLIPLLRSG